MPGIPTSLFVNALVLKSKYLVAFNVYGDDCVPLPVNTCGTDGRKSKRLLVLFLHMME